ncbi:hypothetical protein QM012_000500 [Aureobasidium pullulans]|uniref:F-box domain-containing protein n=1 Tax=Aureobasidium pullulans TaxID=5580 RepID=A0ABR0TW43_AURPU
MPVTINSLPNEVFLDILQHLDYYGLKKCMRVNKAFNVIIKHTAFDRVLFRSATVIGKNGIIQDSTFYTFPVLRHASYIEKCPIGSMSPPEDDPNDTTRFVLCHWVYYDSGDEFSPPDLLLGGYWDS